MGAKRKFDENEVLTVIAEHFWRHGFTATRVDELSEITGLTKTSIYNAFGNKEALFIRVLDFYMELALGPALEQLDLKKPMHTNLKRLLEFFFTQGRNERMAYGCLVTNSIVELEGNNETLYDEATSRYAISREYMRDFFAEYKRSKRLLPSTSVDDLTDLYMTFFQGLRVQARGKDPVGPLKRSIRTFLNIMKTFERK